MADLGEILNKIAFIVMASTMIAGFWESGNQLGNIMNVITQAVANPQQAGVGTVLYMLGYSVWSPVFKAESLGSFSFISVFYPFSEGYIPEYSIWACLVSLIASFILTFIFLHITDRSFWGWGLLVAVVTFVLTWYAFTVLAWFFMYQGAEMLGLSHDVAYDMWKVGAETTQSPILQYLFLANIPLSFQYLIRKFV